MTETNETNKDFRQNKAFQMMSYNLDLFHMPCYPLYVRNKDKSRNVRKRVVGHMRPAKIQISLRIRAG